MSISSTIITILDAAGKVVAIAYPPAGAIAAVIPGVIASVAALKGVSASQAAQDYTVLVVGDQKELLDSITNFQDSIGKIDAELARNSAQAPPTAK